MTEALIPIVLAGLLALVHLATPYLSFLSTAPRSRYLSFAGGASVAYVFLHLLPELAHLSSVAADETDGHGDFPWAWVAALVGLMAIYALERQAKVKGDALGGRQAETKLFRLHLGCSAFYGFLVGYLLSKHESGALVGEFFFFLAFALHFVTADRGMRDANPEGFDRYGRFVLAAVVLAGTLVGLLYDVSPQVLAVAFGFLAGSVILNVMKEELPEERESKLGAFAAGAAAFGGALLLAG